MSDAQAGWLIAQINRQRADIARCPAPPGPQAAATAAAAAALDRSSLLDRIAGARAQELAASGGLTHGQPAGSALRGHAQALGLKADVLAENLARGPITFDGLLAAWLASPPHCANLMDPRHEAAGLACATAADGTVWVLTLARLRPPAPPPSPPR
jgi:uncharacterized protein YkwD